MKARDRDAGAAREGRRARRRRGRLLLLVALGLVVATSVAAGSATAAVEAPAPPSVWSDRADYAPGALVILSGSDWAPGEVVHIRVNDDAGQTWSRDTDVTAADDGTISDQFNLPDWFVAQYSVTATGASSGTATWTFTDGNVNGGTLEIRESACATAQSSFTSPSTVCAHAAVTVQGGGPTSWAIQWYAPGVNPQTGPSVDAAAFTEVAGTTSATRNDTFTVSTAGTWTVLICKTGDTDKCSSGNTVATAAFTVTANAAPVIARNNATVTVTEGATAANTGTWSDANAGDSVTLSASAGTVTKSGTNAGGTWSWSFGTNDGPGQSQTVTITANDGTTASSTTFSLTVNNAAPTGTLTNDGPKDEGGAAAISFAGISDPSSIDAASLHYAFDCAGGSLAAVTYAGAGTSSSTSCTFSDDGSFSVSGAIIDKNGGRFATTTTVTVNNVAPSATFENDGPVDEGSSFHLSLTSPSDPSSADTSAGFDYAFDCGSGYGAFSATSTADCSTNDDGSRSVKGKIRDKDGDVSEYTASVRVDNVAPTVTLTGPDSADEGDTKSYSYSWTDPGSADSFAAADNSISCGIHGTASDVVFTAETGSFKCTWSDDSGAGTAAVSATVADDDGGAGTDTIDIPVANVAPRVNLTGPDTANEGDSETYHFVITDPGTADTFSFVTGYPTCGDHGEVVGTPAIGDGQFDCRFPDGPATTDVKVTLKDDDGGTSVADAEHVEIISVAVANVAPTLTAAADQISNEGASQSFSLGSFADPGTDSPWAVDVDWGDGSSTPTFDEMASGAASGQTIAAKSHTYDDNGTYTVTVTVTDKNGSADSKTLRVTVANVAPTATLENNGPIDEGNSATVSFSGASDPSSADTSAGFHYAYSCSNGDLSGTTYAESGTATTTSCAYDDDGSYPVKGRIIDKDGGYTEYTSTVVVSNVAPTATLSDNGPANEGSAFTVQLTGPSDPSGADTTAGFQYAFDCGDGAGYGAYGSANSRSCPTTDNGSRTVKGKVKDKDGGYTAYSATVTINNVAPHITSVSASATFAGPLVFMTSTIQTLFTDPGSADTWTNLLTFSDGSPPETGTTVVPQGGDAYRLTQTHRFTTPGCKTVTSKVTDDDGGSDTSTGTPVDVGAGEFLPPVTNTPVTNKLKSGQVLPVKIKLTGCSGAPVTSLTPAIVVKKGDLTSVADDSAVTITPGSVSAADTTGVMRSNGDGSYIYNMSVSGMSLNTDYTIVIYPFGITSQSMAHVIQVTK